jgi:hypothetical protein
LQWFTRRSRAEPDHLVDERLGDLLAQRQFAGCAEALDHIVVDGDLSLVAAELA